MNSFRRLAGLIFPFIAIAVSLSPLIAGPISPQDSANLEAARDSTSKLGFLADTNRTLPMLFIVGDSTVHNLQKTERGWGDVISGYFDPTKIRVENHALGGRSSRTFQTQGWWDIVQAAARPGDFVLIQLGHNDGGPLDDTNRARGTLGGLGEETRDIYNPIMKKPEVVHTYGWYLRKYIADARARGMTPILCSPVPRCPKEAVRAGEVESNNYVSWSGQIATNEHVPFINLNRITMGHYAGLSQEEVKTKYFTPADNTHASLAGAELNAASVIEGLRALKECPLKACLLAPSGLMVPATGAGAH